MRHLYAGFRVNLVCDVANQALAFGAFGLYQAEMNMRHKRALSSYEKVAGGMVAGIVASSLLTFVERLMIIEQVGFSQLKTNHVKPQVFEIASYILKQEGAKGLYKGFIPTVMRESINSMFYFGFSKIFHQKIQQHVADEKAKVLSYALSGAASGFLTTPFDLIKTRMQKQIGQTSCSSWDEVKAATGGEIGQFRALFKGALARSAMLSTIMVGMDFFASHTETFIPAALRLKS